MTPLALKESSEPSPKVLNAHTDDGKHMLSSSLLGVLGRFVECLVDNISSGNTASSNTIKRALSTEGPIVFVLVAVGTKSRIEE